MEEELAVARRAGQSRRTVALYAQAEVTRLTPNPNERPEAITGVERFFS